METKESIAIEALRNILSPITYLENQAKAEGNILDGYYAVKLSIDASFLKEIAEKALNKIDQL